jgi:hypothetical protein
VLHIPETTQSRAYVLAGEICPSVPSMHDIYLSGRWGNAGLPGQHASKRVLINSAGSELGECALIVRAKKHLNDWKAKREWGYICGFVHDRLSYRTCNFE